MKKKKSQGCFLKERKTEKQVEWLFVLLFFFLIWMFVLDDTQPKTRRKHRISEQQLEDFVRHGRPLGPDEESIQSKIFADEDETL